MHKIMSLFLRTNVRIIILRRAERGFFLEEGIFVKRSTKVVATGRQRPRKTKTYERRLQHKEAYPYDDGCLCHI